MSRSTSSSANLSSEDQRGDYEKQEPTNSYDGYGQYPSSNSNLACQHPMIAAQPDFNNIYSNEPFAAPPAGFYRPAETLASGANSNYRDPIFEAQDNFNGNMALGGFAPVDDENVDRRIAPHIISPGEQFRNGIFQFNLQSPVSDQNLPHLYLCSSSFTGEKGYPGYSGMNSQVDGFAGTTNTNLSVESSIDETSTALSAPPELPFFPIGQSVTTNDPSQVAISALSHGHAISPPSSQASSQGSIVPSGFACHHPLCYRSLRRRSDRDRHARKHDGVKTSWEYACPQPHCAMTFYRKDKLQDHLRRGHSF